ncbi:MAG: 23S rRNA (adenine(2503)-C(2))-methyltransferase RlmN, partial [Acidobacteria bacterium]|nr:23S rRNA (adenine(2503)-C(2))-methyltransferase RlmN [Acidobacteriota bacterium]
MGDRALVALAARNLRAHDVQSLLELSPAELSERLAEVGEPSYRSDQVFHWIFKEGASEFAQMTNLPRELRKWLATEFTIGAGRETARSEAPGGTVKLLLSWRDGATTECVMIPASAQSGIGNRRRTVCLSTQVGCDVGCRFCASGIDGALRNLTVGEVLDQALAVRNLLAARGERLSNVVFMGMGEPLANYSVTVEAARRLNA